MPPRVTSCIFTNFYVKLCTTNKHEEILFIYPPPSCREHRNRLIQYGSIPERESEIVIHTDEFEVTDENSNLDSFSDVEDSSNDVLDVTISDQQVNTLVPKEVEIWPTLREVPGPKDISHSHEDGPTHHLKSFYPSHLISG